MQEHCWLVVETGGTKMLARIVQGSTVLLEGRWLTTSPQAAVDALCEFAARSPVRIAGGGIAAFGPVVVDRTATNYGEILATPKPGWTGANLRRTLSSRLGVTVETDTDVNAAALAEQLTGAGKGCPSVAYVTIGTGIGAGLASMGRTLSGALHPEMGHVPVLRYKGDAAASTCPFHASCAEGMAAGPAVQGRLGGRPLQEVPQAFDAVADYLGQLFATIVLAWSPHRIIAGGGVLGTPGLRDAAKAKMEQALGGYGVGTAAQGEEFVVAPQHEHAGLEGALILARRSLKAGSVSHP